MSWTEFSLFRKNSPGDAPRLGFGGLKLAARLVPPVLGLAGNDFITITRPLPQPASVYKIYRSAHILDQAGFLKHARCNRDTRPPGSQHVREKFLRQRHH